MDELSQEENGRAFGVAGLSGPYCIAGAILLIGLVLSALLAVAMRNGEHSRIRYDFEQASQDQIAAIRKTIALDLMEMRSVRAFYDGSGEVNRHEFHVFTDPLLKSRRSIRALEWAPRVPDAERADYEAKAARDGFPNFKIADCNRQFRLTPAPRRNEYFPVFFVEPGNGNLASLGCDLATAPTCLEAMNRARDTDQLAATSKVLLSREQGYSFGVRAFLPVYRKNVASNTVDRRRRNLTGFVVGILFPDAIVEDSVAALAPAGIDVRLFDSTDPFHKQILAHHLSRSGGVQTVPNDSEIPSRQSDLSCTEMLTVGERSWAVVCEATPEFILRRLSWHPWGGGAAGLLLTGLLTAYLVGVARRSAQEKHMTAQLFDINRRLECEMLERHEAELHLHVSQTRYRALYEFSHDAILVVTPEDGFLCGNPAAVALFGCKDEQEFMTHGLADMSPERQPDGEPSSTKAAKMIAATMQGGSHFFEWTHRRVDGTEFPATVLLTRMELEGLAVLQATVRDVTAMKEAQRRQMRSLKRLEGVNRLQEDLLLPASLENKLKMIADAAVELMDLDFCRIWIVRPADLCQSGCIHAAVEDEARKCVHRDHCLHLVASAGRYTDVNGSRRRVPLSACKIGQIATGKEFKFLTNNAATDPCVSDHRWAQDLGLVSFAGYKLRDANGDPVGVLGMFAKHPFSEEDDAFMFNLAELTSRVVMFHRIADALKRENAKLMAMISGMNEGVAFASADNTIVEANDYMCRFMSKTRDEIIGRRIDDLHLGQPREHVLRLIDQFRGQVGSEPYVIQRPLGGTEVIMRVQPIYRDGDYDGVLVNVIDVSELVAARRQAEQANLAKSRFLATMSHEIRTPMTALLGYAELLLDPAISPSSRISYAATIRRNSEHLLTLINDILDLSRIEAGKMSLEMVRCNVVLLLAEIASILRIRAEQHGVSFSVIYASEIPETILTDSARLRQAIVNLVGNAIKFTEEGSVRILVSFLRDGYNGQPALRFDVIDTGIGIREDVLPQLFQPFNQGDSSVSRKFGGTGLGLAITRHIASLLGGELTATSVWGQGSTFTLTVPTGELDGIHMLQRPTEVEYDSAAHTLQTPTESLRGTRILLAEDGFDNRELVRAVLLRAGADVAVVENGRLAVEKAERESFDLILLDMNMPEMDGYEATRVLRDHGYDKPIVALTANAMLGDRADCIAAGCNEYLIKPIDRKQLIQTIAAFIDKETIAARLAQMGDIPGREAGQGLPADREHAAAGDDQAARDRQNAQPTDGSAAAIVSQFIDDPDVAQIIPGFVRRLGNQLAAMTQALVEERHEELRHLAHTLKGAGGSYGYPSLSEACLKLENAAKAKDRVAAEVALKHVAELISGIENGYSAALSTGSPT
jgi:PAS domain S-box-containing protein